MTEAKQATPHSKLINELMDSRFPKTEREHAAAREIEWLRAVISDAERRTDVQQEMEQEACDPLKGNIDYGRGFLDGMAWHGVPKEGDKLSLPCREWVGLTDEDLSVCDEDGVLLARYWEAKLKEKNS